MIVEFVAGEAKCVVENGCVLVALGAEDEYLFLSRSEEPGDAWGVHLEYSEHINSAYGCIDSCALTATLLEVSLSSRIDTLPEIEGLRVTYTATPEAREAVAEGLRTIFRGNEEQLTIDA